MPKISSPSGILLGIGLILLIGVMVFISKQAGFNSLPSPHPSVTASVLPTPATSPNPQATPVGNNQIKIFLIALEDNGKSGKKIGCNDSVVGVDQTITPTSAPLRAALEKLLSIKQQNYGQSGLYNSLYQSNLQIEKLDITNGKAIIRLTGSMALGGVCDDPRFKAQIEETALQFPTVQQVEVFINDKPIDEVLSEK